MKTEGLTAKNVGMKTEAKRRKELQKQGTEANRQGFLGSAHAHKGKKVWCRPTEPHRNMLKRLIFKWYAWQDSNLRPTD